MARATKTAATRELRLARTKASSVVSLLEHASSVRYGARTDAERREALLDACRMADELSAQAERARWAVRYFAADILDGTRVSR